jgi:hypothetical protein
MARIITTIQALYAIIMRHFSLIIGLFVFAICKGQATLKEYNFPQVDWTLRIPATSNFLDSAQFETISKKAVNAINKTYDADFSFTDIKLLFTIRQGQFNLLGSTINLFDTTLGMTWVQSYSASKVLIMQVINEQAPAVKIIDTLSTYEVIDGLRFEKLYLKTFYPDQKLTMNTYWFYRKQNEYDFSINISYTDEGIGKQFLDLIKASRFDK